MHETIGVLRKIDTDKDDEEFYARFFYGLSQIRNCVFENEKRHEYDKNFKSVRQNLIEMNFARKKCIALISKHLEAVGSGKDGIFHGHQIDIKEPIDDDLNVFFKDFFIRGEMAMRCLIEHSRYMGSYIGSLFIKNEKKFEKKTSKKFDFDKNDQNFMAFKDFIFHHRANWYESFQDLRGKIEHAGWCLPQIEYRLNSKNETQVLLPTFKKNKKIEDVLDYNWSMMNIFCEDIAVYLLSMKLKKEMILVFVPEGKGDAGLPIRYFVSLKEYPGVPLSC